MCHKLRLGLVEKYSETVTRNIRNRGIHAPAKTSRMNRTAYSSDRRSLVLNWCRVATGFNITRLYWPKEKILPIPAINAHPAIGEYTKASSFPEFRRLVLLPILDLSNPDILHHTFHVRESVKSGSY